MNLQLLCRDVVSRECRPARFLRVVDDSDINVQISGLVVKWVDVVFLLHRESSAQYNYLYGCWSCCFGFSIMLFLSLTFISTSTSIQVLV